MTMRNFWIEGQIDGRENNMTGGPRRADGGFDLDVRMRENGTSVRALRVVGVVDGTDGSLWLRAYDGDGKRIMEVHNER